MKVNIKWIPDDIERLLYVNVITLMLQVMDEVVSGMSINFAGHNVKMSLTHLEAEANTFDDIAVAKLAAKASTAAIASLDSKDQTLLEKFVGN